MKPIQLWKNNRIFLILIIAMSIAAYLGFAYRFQRTAYLELAVLYSALFASYFYFVSKYKENFKLLAALSIAFRLLFLLAIPNLSQDFFRFIWDGRMILANFNPYLYTPNFFIESSEFPVAQALELHAGMGPLSASNNTNYPPLNQMFFVIAGIFAGKSILGSTIVMRLLIIVADIGTLTIGKKLLEKLKMPTHRIFWYLLNPLIIIELSGNLHFEGVMVFFLILGVYLLHINRWKVAAVFFSLSVSIKLIPLLFIPLLFKKLGWKNWMMFSAIVGFISALFFLPFYSIEFATNYANTVALWFQKFEFNASIYYLIREIGYSFRGYNEIAIIGLVLSVLVLFIVVGMAILRKNKETNDLITTMMLALAFFYFTTTTMHPWYLATLLLLSVFSKYRFVLVWSFVIFLSYFAYTNGDSQENLWLVFLEYLIVYGVLIYELYTIAKSKKPTIITHGRLR
ncbi:MAG: mannosyltransferase [Bacteroidia bacterium]|nr:mannosyltransferase [Bacteroidia bacterium]